MAEIAGFDSIPLLMASSLIYLIASSSACNDYCDGYTIWAVIVAVVSLAVTGGIVALKATGRGSLITRVHQHIAVFLFVLWLLGAALGTFKRPFPFVGNGYFSAWISFGVSTLYAYASSAKVRQAIDSGMGAMRSTQGEDAVEEMGGAEPAGSNV